jgi:hypothetical protein
LHIPSTLLCRLFRYIAKIRRLREETRAQYTYR